MKLAYKYSYAKRDHLRRHLFRPPEDRIEVRYYVGSAVRHGWGIVVWKDEGPIQWCELNLRAVHPSNPRARAWTWDSRRGLLAIADERDAMAFKMRWG
jgi:hypothetical protein